MSCNHGNCSQQILERRTATEDGRCWQKILLRKTTKNRTGGRMAATPFPSTYECQVLAL